MKRGGVVSQFKGAVHRAGESQHRELEAASLTSAVRKQTDAGVQSLSPSSAVWDPGPWMMIPTVRVGLST